MCMIGDDDYWSFYNEFTPLARKTHTCGECGRTIGRGERYHTQGGLAEDRFEWHKTCAHCTIASRWLQVVCDGWVFTARFEDLREHVDGDEKYLRSRPLVRLVRWMRDDWHDKAGELRPIEEVRRLVDEAIAAYKARMPELV